MDAHVGRLNGIGKPKMVSFDRPVTRDELGADGIIRIYESGEEGKTNSLCKEYLYKFPLQLEREESLSLQSESAIYAPTVTIDYENVPRQCQQLSRELSHVCTSSMQVHIAIRP
jgi:hypothetical protein